MLDEGRGPEAKGGCRCRGVLVKPRELFRVDIQEVCVEPREWLGGSAVAC